MKIGTYYYPEQWPREQWERDLDQIAAMGLKIVHMAEFAWFAMEPSPGDIQLDWLAECVEMCRARGLDVILCTPTAAPPVWLGDQYPETLPMDQHGTRDRHGGRRHYTPTSVKMQETTFRIVSAMAQRFGDHPSVIGWQIDNELGYRFDQSEPTHHAFRQWLRKKYTTIENLNAAWANQFWNQYYQDFEQVLMPPSRDPHYKNQHHMLDASRFWSRAWADFVKLQSDILRPKVGDRFITTNFMNFFTEYDPKEMLDSLDMWTWDSYPVSGFGRDHKDENYRLGDPASIEFNHDHMASFNGRWALMEVQPGQINWSGYPVLTYPGAVRLWLWSAIAHGCEFITVYRYRQPRFGIEMWHDGLVTLDGVSLSEGGKQFKQVAAEAKKIWKDVHPTSIDSAQPKAGLLVDYDQIWYAESLPQAKRWNQREFVLHYHQALSRMGLKVQIIHPDQPWPDDLKIVAAPGMQLMDEPLRDRLAKFADRGGHLVLTCRSGLMDRNGQFYETAYGELIRDLIGATITRYDSLPEDTWGTLKIEAKTHKWGVWGDQLLPDKKTKSWATYTNMFYSGAVGITHRSTAKGSVTYNGVFGDRALAEAVIEKVCKVAGVKLKPLPNRVRVLERDGYKICTNFSDKPVIVPAGKKTKFLVGGPKIPGGGVAVWKA